MTVGFLAPRQSIEPYFSSEGRPAVEPILCLKLELIMFHDGLSDRQVFARAKTDIAYRLFLGLGRNDHLPDVSTLRGFRTRLGVDRHQDVFHALVNQARTHGLVKDGLRIKDARHVPADIAIPAGLQLIAQARNKLLTAAARFAAECVLGERVHIESIRTSTDSRTNSGQRFCVPKAVGKQPRASSSPYFAHRTRVTGLADTLRRAVSPGIVSLFRLVGVSKKGWQEPHKVPMHLVQASIGHKFCQR